MWRLGPTSYPQVQVVRVKDRSRFQLTHARNVGAQAAKAPWLCFIDADVFMEPSFTETVLPLLRPGRFYKATAIDSGLCGTVLCPRDDFARIDGYDEVFQGYGFEDSDFYGRLRWVGLVQDGLPAHLLSSLPHDNELRVKFYDVKQRALSTRINENYAKVKYEIMRFLGRPPALDVRRKLYALLTNWAERSVELSGCDLNFDIRQRSLPLNGAVEFYFACTMTDRAQKKEKEIVIIDIF